MDATIRHSRRGLFGPAGALAGSAALAACGAPGAPSEGSGTARQALSGTVRIWANPAFPFHEDLGGQIAAGLMAKYPNVKVQAESISEDRTQKLIVSVAGGDAADLVSIEPYHVQGLGKKSIRDALQETEARVQAVVDAWKR